MNKYLILYGNDGSTFYTEAADCLAAVLELAKYTGNTLAPIYEKALRSMDKPTEIITLYNSLVDGYDEIQEVYKIDSVVYFAVKKGNRNDKRDHC